MTISTLYIIDRTVLKSFSGGLVWGGVGWWLVKVVLNFVIVVILDVVLDAVLNVVLDDGY